MTDEQQLRQLHARSTAEATRAHAEKYRLPVTLDIVSAITLVALLQLAGRHPGLQPSQRRFQLVTVAKIIDCLRQDGLIEVAAMLELGNDPTNDILGDIPN